MYQKTRLLLAFAAAGLMACAGGDSKVSIWLTDAPGDEITAATVTIEEIYLQGESEDEIDARVVLRDARFTTDLLTLSNDVVQLVDGAIVPAGTYGQLRFVISGAYIAVAGDDSTAIYATAGYPFVPAGAEIAGALRTPSWNRSGFKVKTPAGALDLTGEQKLLVVDFDVADSVGHGTGAGDWVLRPTLRAHELATTGSITVVVDASEYEGLAMTLFEVELLDGDGVREGLLGLSDDDGDRRFSATFAYLDPRAGPFTIDIREAGAMDLVTRPAVPLQVDLESGQDLSVELDIDFVMIY